MAYLIQGSPGHESSTHATAPTCLLVFVEILIWLRWKTNLFKLVAEPGLSVIGICPGKVSTAQPATTKKKKKELFSMSWFRSKVLRVMSPARLPLRQHAYLLIFCSKLTDLSTRLRVQITWRGSPRYVDFGLLIRVCTVCTGLASQSFHLPVAVALQDKTTSYRIPAMQ